MAQNMPPSGRYDVRYPFGAHGILIAAPISLLLWAVIALPFLLR